MRELSRGVVLRLGATAVVLTGLVLSWVAMLGLSWFELPGLDGGLDEVVQLADLMSLRHFTVLTHSYLEVGGVALLTGLSVAALGVCAHGHPQARLVVAGLAGIFAALLLFPAVVLLFGLSGADAAVTGTGLLWLLVGCALATGTVVVLLRAARAPVVAPLAPWPGWFVPGALIAVAVIHLLVVLDFFTPELPARTGAWLPVLGYLVAAAGAAAALRLPPVEAGEVRVTRDEVGLSLLDGPYPVEWELPPDAPEPLDPLLPEHPAAAPEEPGHVDEVRDHRDGGLSCPQGTVDDGVRPSEGAADGSGSRGGDEPRRGDEEPPEPEAGHAPGPGDPEGETPVGGDARQHGEPGTTTAPASTSH